MNDHFGKYVIVILCQGKVSKKNGLYGLEDLAVNGECVYPKQEA